MRKYSIDELPQIWDIFTGNMNVIGTHPGLWNQDFLTAERDKYGANDIKSCIKKYTRPKYGRVYSFFYVAMSSKSISILDQGKPLKVFRI